ncbi:hypothetical protein ACJX0J_019960, partial [Zea mays]
MIYHDFYNRLNQTGETLIIMVYSFTTVRGILHDDAFSRFRSIICVFYSNVLCILSSLLWYHYVVLFLLQILFDINTGRLCRSYIDEDILEDLLSLNLIENLKF